MVVGILRIEVYIPGNRSLKGKRMVLTYRGRPVLLLEPIRQEEVKEDDPFYSIDQLASRKGAPLSNDDMDQVIYEI